MIGETEQSLLLLKRVEQLEHQHKRINQLAVALLLLGSAAFTMGQARPAAPRAIDVSKITFLSSSGKAIATLGANSSDTGLEVRDPEGVIRLSINGLTGFTPGGFTNLSLADGKGNGALTLLADLDESSINFVQTNTSGSGRAAIPLQLRLEKGSPSIDVDDNGFETVIGASNLVTPATGESHQTSAASIVMFKDKRVIWRAPLQ
jgi:hypothetical protein